MSRGGAPRKQGKRERNGRIAREPVHMVRETVAVQRCKAMGWSPTLDNQKKAASATYGTKHGQLFGTGKISADEYAAAELFQQRDHTYRSVRGMPRPTISAANIEGSTGGTSADLDPEEQRKISEAASSALEDVRRALLDANAIMSATTLVIMQEDIDEFALPSLKRGLQSVFNACIQGQRKAG